MYVGRRVSHLGDDLRKKLKACYTLVEQLYSGTQRIISATSFGKPAPSTIQDTLNSLSILPARLEEVKKSAARVGALLALTRAKAWVPDLDPEEVLTGFPDTKEDGSTFNEKDLYALTKEMRPLASKLAVESDLSRYHPSYNLQNERVERPVYDIVNLIPPVRPHTFAPDIDPAELINDEVYFRALAKIDWRAPDFPPLHEEEDVPEQDGGQPSQQGEAQS